MAASSDGYLFYRTAVGSDLTAQQAFASGVTGAAVSVIAVRNATTAINVQRIRIVPISYGVGSVTLRETDATGTVIASLTQQGADATGTNASGPQFIWTDFGPQGWKMTAGTNLVLVRSSATGPGFNLVVEAYGTTSGAVAMAYTN